MPDEYKYDVFLSHSSKDEDVVRDLAKRLSLDGLKVWYDDWEIRWGENIWNKVEEGLEQSRFLILCMSQNAFNSEWVQFESQAVRMNDPLNKSRRLLPLLLDDVKIKGSLEQFKHFDWRPPVRDLMYPRLLLFLTNHDLKSLPPNPSPPSPQQDSSAPSPPWAGLYGYEHRARMLGEKGASAFHSTDASFLDGKWKASLFEYDENHKSKPFKFLDNGKYKPYPSEIVIIKSSGAQIWIQSSFGDDDEPFWGEGRISRGGFLTMWYWSAPGAQEDIVGVNFLQVEKNYPKLTLSGHWIGRGRDNKVHYGEIHYERLSKE